MSPWIWGEEGDEILAAHGGLDVGGALVQALPLGDRLHHSRVPVSRPESFALSNHKKRRQQ